MSHANGQCRFPDGLILHFEYNGTSDYCYNRLRKTNAEVWEHWRSESSNDAECTCGQADEEVVLSTDYGRGFSFPGRACRRCMCITKDGMLDPDNIH